ncbi:MAG: inositol monophosphatase family protein [Rubricoccaceae bacterium]
MYDSERIVAETAARAAAVVIRQHAGQLSSGDVRSKGTHDLVTVADEAAEHIILSHLTRAFPDDDLLGEETAPDDLQPVAGRRWIVDPIDGTTNFMHGVPPYGVSIGLQDNGVGVLGVILEVTSGELFVGIRGGGLTVNGVSTTVSETRQLDDALVATGFPFRDYRYVDGYLETFERAIRSTRGVRRPGAASIDLAWTAAGRFDGFFEAGLSPWDVAAGIVLVEAAGGRVSALPDTADPVYGGGLVASNGHIHASLLEVTEPLSIAYGESR